MAKHSKLKAALEEIQQLSNNKNEGKSLENRAQHILEAHLGKENVEFQPNGSQQTPDIRVTLENEQQVDIEVKTSKTGIILWNSGLPKEGAIYIYSNTEDGGITFFMGEEIITSEERDALEMTRKANQATADITNKQLKASKSSWNFYPRPMHNNTSKPLEAKDKDKREKRVLSFASETEKEKKAETLQNEFELSSV